MLPASGNGHWTKTQAKKFDAGPFLSPAEIRQSILNLCSEAGQLSQVTDWILLGPVACRFGLEDVKGDIYGMALVDCRLPGRKLCLEENCVHPTLTSYQWNSMHMLALNGMPNFKFRLLAWLKLFMCRFLPSLPTTVANLASTRRHSATS